MVVCPALSPEMALVTRADLTLALIAGRASLMQRARGSQPEDGGGRPGRTRTNPDGSTTRHITDLRDLSMFLPRKK